MNKKLFLRIPWVISLLGMLLAMGGLTAKAQNPKEVSPDKTNSSMILKLIGQIGGSTIMICKLKISPLTYSRE
jgi:hypothetical protein